jgi:hypothetical protein
VKLARWHQSLTGKGPAELESHWAPYPAYWDAIHHQANQVDQLIEKYNRKVGLLD